MSPAIWRRRTAVGEMIDWGLVAVIALFIFSIAVLLWDRLCKQWERAEWETDVRRSIAQSYASLWHEERVARENEDNEEQ